MQTSQSESSQTPQGQGHSTLAFQTQSRNANQVKKQLHTNLFISDE